MTNISRSNAFFCTKTRGGFEEGSKFGYYSPI